MFQSMDITAKISQFLLVYHKALFLKQLFLIYINDLNIAIKHCKVHHFADDTNLLHSNDPIKNLFKAVNFDFKNLTNWLILLLRSH